jgi:Family of unknown function (DUF5996)
VSSAAVASGPEAAGRARSTLTHTPSRRVSPHTGLNQTPPYSDELKEFLLPYEAVRTADDPDRAVARFLQTTYQAAAELGGWDRSALECDPGRLQP